MADLTNPKIIKLKGLLFLLMGLFSAVLLLIYVSNWTVALLLAISLWSF